MDPPRNTGVVPDNPARPDPAPTLRAQDDSSPWAGARAVAHPPIRRYEAPENSPGMVPLDERARRLGALEQPDHIIKHGPLLFKISRPSEGVPQRPGHEHRARRAKLRRYLSSRCSPTRWRCPRVPPRSESARPSGCRALTRAPAARPPPPPRAAAAPPPAPSPQRAARRVPHRCGP